MLTKRPWQSKEFWFSGLFLLTALANLFGFAGFEPSGEVKDLALVLTTLVPLILRVFFTERKITL